METKLVVSEVSDKILRYKEKIQQGLPLIATEQAELLELLDMLNLLLEESEITDKLYFRHITKIINNILFESWTSRIDSLFKDLFRNIILYKKSNTSINDVLSVLWIMNLENENIDIIEKKILFIVCFMYMKRDYSLTYQTRIKRLKWKKINLQDENELSWTWLTKLPLFTVDIDNSNKLSIIFEEGNTYDILDKYSRC